MVTHEVEPRGQLLREVVVDVDRSLEDHAGHVPVEIHERVGSPEKVSVFPPVIAAEDVPGLLPWLPSAAPHRTELVEVEQAQPTPQALVVDDLARLHRPQGFAKVFAGLELAGEGAFSHLGTPGDQIGGLVAL